MHVYAYVSVTSVPGNMADLEFVLVCYELFEHMTRHVICEFQELLFTFCKEKYVLNVHVLQRCL